VTHSLICSTQSSKTISESINMGTKNLEIIKPKRERGTLNETLPKQPIILISLVCIASAALSTALLLYSTPHLLVTTNKDVMKLLFIACLGSISTLVGVIFSDSLSHVVSFGVAVSLRYVICLQTSSCCYVWCCNLTYIHSL
jgi:hypothetical protein